MQKHLYSVFLVALSVWLGAQDTIESLGGDLAVVHAFSRSEVGGGLMTTDLEVVPGECVYAANQSGLLVFDGGGWELVPMPNRGVSRSLLPVEEGVWVGGQGFLGKLVSLEPVEWQDWTGELIAAAGDFGDVWGLEAGAGGMFVRTSSFVGFLSEEGAFRVLASGSVTTGFKVDEGYACQRGEALLRFDAQGRLMGEWELPKGVRVQAWIDGADPRVLTHSRGVWQWDGSSWLRESTPASAALSEARANVVVASPEGWLVGTAQGGVVVTRDWSSVSARYAESAGLTGTSVVDIAVDDIGNAWVAAEGGLNIIRFSWPQRVPQMTESLKESGYSSLHLASGRRYWGTSLGVKTQASRNAPLVPVIGVEDQTWSLQLLNDRPWVSHLSGAGWLEGAEYVPVIQGVGVWEVIDQPGTPFHYAGTFNGLMRLDLSGKHPPVPVEGFQETARFVAFESQRVVWVAYPYKGVYRVELDEEGTRAVQVRLYAGADGLPEPVHVEVFDAAGDPIFSTNDGFYRYDAAADRLVPAREAFAGMIPREGHVERLYAGEHATWWFLQGQTAGQIHPQTSNLKTSMEVRRIPLTGTPLVAPFERLELLTEDRVCVPVESGFLYLDANRMAVDAAPPALTVHSVTHLNSGEGARNLPVDHTTLNPGNHALEIRLRGFDPNWAGVQRYQWRLDDEGAEWSRPQESARVMLGGLGPGTHRIQFRAIIEDGFTGPVTDWEVRVDHPWHERWEFRALLLALLLAGGIWFIRWKQRRIRIEHARDSARIEADRVRSEERYRREIESTELRLEAERLRRVEAEVAAKNQELASATMHLVQKAQMTATLQTGLQALRESVATTERKQVDKLLSVLGASSRLDDNWEQFTQQFDQVHVEFHKRLLEQFPDLTKNDLKLCTYLRMNLSSKEIASLTFVTVRAVEVSRSRLRKRLGLDPSENLLQFIQSL